MLTRNQKGQFVKGVCPNPSGRPKQIQAIRELARAHPGDAIQTLVSITKNEKASDSARIRGCEVLLAYAFGKPTQHVESVSVKASLGDFLDSLDTSEADVIDI